MAEKYYGVAHGKKPGVYENWSDVQKQIKDFPQPVYKKFTKKEEAEEYVKARRPEKSVFPSDRSAAKFYAVARGKTIGIFTDYEEVKKSITGYPQPLYKKFENYEEAETYFYKYQPSLPSEEHDKVNSKKAESAESTKREENKADGEGKKVDDEEKKVDGDEKKTDGEKKKGCGEEKKTVAKQKEKEKPGVFYAVARGHRTGVFATWAECQEQTKDFKGAKFKKFDNEEDAKQFAEGKTLKQIEDRKRPHGDDKTNEPKEKKPATRPTRAKTSS